VIRTLAASEHLFGFSDLRGRKRGASAEALATALRGRETRDGALAQHVVFKLRHGAEHRVQHATRGCAGVDVVGERSQRDVAGL